MFILQLLSNPAIAIVTLAAIVLAITVHEWAHAWTATRLGDDTPRLMGRVTLDPAAHIDPMGGLMFLLIGFGWGKPVIYNPLRLRRRVDELLIALAGPISNLLTALIVNGIRVGLATAFNSNTSANWQAFLGYLVIVSYFNVVLAAFNLLPFPPLDGSSIIAHFYRPWRDSRLRTRSSSSVVRIAR